MGYKPEVWTYGSTRWDSNGLVFATEKEAQDYVQDLMWRWTSVDKTRVVETDEPVTHVFRDQVAKRIEDEPRLADHVTGGNEKGEIE